MIASPSTEGPEPGWVPSGEMVPDLRVGDVGRRGLVSEDLIRGAGEIPCPVFIKKYSRIRSFTDGLQLDRKKNQ